MARVVGQEAVGEKARSGSGQGVGDIGGTRAAAALMNAAGGVAIGDKDGLQVIGEAAQVVFDGMGGRCRLDEQERIGAVEDHAVFSASVGCADYSGYGEFERARPKEKGPRILSASTRSC